MLSADDLISLAYTPDLTRAGIAYVGRALPHLRLPSGGARFHRLRQMVAEQAAALAFRRLLAERDVPHDLVETKSVGGPEALDAALGGRRCRIVTRLLSRKRDVRRLRRRPEALLGARALVPQAWGDAGRYGEGDLFLFTFLLALVTRGPKELEKALAAGQPCHLVYPLPEAWRRPARWASLGELALKADTVETLELELGGQGGERRFLSRAVSLAPRTRLVVQSDFHALSYLHVAALPGGPLGVHSQALDETLLVRPAQWGNLWLYGVGVILAGYLPRGEFRRRAERLPPGHRELGIARTQVENLALPVGELRPLEGLLASARRWAQQNR